jgi:hypothetical protein
MPECLKHQEQMIHKKNTLENCPKTSSPFVNKRTKSGQKRRGGIPSRPPSPWLATKHHPIPFLLFQIQEAALPEVFSTDHPIEPSSSIAQWSLLALSQA